MKNVNLTPYAFFRIPWDLGEIIDKLAKENDPPASRNAMAASLLRRAIKAMPKKSGKPAKAS